MSKPELKVIEGGKAPDAIEVVEIPERKDFPCWSCGEPCVLWPRANPPSIQHSTKVCAEWKKIQSGAEDLERFAIKCGVEMLVAPKGQA